MYKEIFVNCHGKLQTTFSRVVLVVVVVVVVVAVDKISIIEIK